MPKYRPNVAAIILRADHRIFVGERLKVANAWQFPQGGVDEGEDLIAALRREVGEELGLASKHFEIAECRTGYRYKFPKGHRKFGNWRGQEQTYFLCKFKGMDSCIDLDAHEREFSRFQWILPEEYELSWLPDFKKKVYRQVFRDFFQIDLKKKSNGDS